ncbi:MAG: hypothetical protein K0R71_1809 [Bacillales bacterium]|nr:hypothetical protein [Bacillales bacterium]
MSASNRNNRLLFVITLLGLLGVLLKGVFTFAKSNYTSVYEGNIPIGMDHMFTHALISDVIIVLITSILYCYFEAHTFYSYSNEKMEFYKKRSDTYFLRLLTSIKLSFVITLLIFSLMLFIPVFNSITEKALLVLAIIIFVITILSYVDFKNKILKLIFSGIRKQIKENLTFEFFYYWLITFISLFLIVMFFGIESNLNTKIEVKFSNQTGKMQLNYSDTTSDKMPNRIRLIINGRETVFYKHDFLEAGISVKKSQNREILFKETQIIKQDLKGAQVLYTRTVDLNEMLNEGVNKIEIKFEVNNLLNINSKEEYSVINTVNKFEGSFEFAKQNFKIRIQ